MRTSVKSNESGMAIVTALLVLMLASGLMAGHVRGADRRSAVARDRPRSEHGLRRGTRRPGEADVDPRRRCSPPTSAPAPRRSTPSTTCRRRSRASSTPRRAAAPARATTISFTPDPGPGPNTGNPLAQNADITTGPFAGFKGLITPYIAHRHRQVDDGHSEVRLRRELQTVAVPVFQFGIFGENDLGFHAGPELRLRRPRPHQRTACYLAQGNGNELTFRDKITAFTQVKRDTLMNGVADHHRPTTPASSRCRRRSRAPAWRNLLRPPRAAARRAAPCVAAGRTCRSRRPTTTNIRTEATGAKQLILPLAIAGRAADRPDPPAGACNSNEHTANRAGLRPAVLRPGQPAHPALGPAPRTSPTCRR